MGDIHDEVNASKDRFWLIADAGFEVGTVHSRETAIDPKHR